MYFMDGPQKSVLQLTKMHESFISFGKLFGSIIVSLFEIDGRGWVGPVGLLEIDEEIDEV